MEEEHLTVILRLKVGRSRVRFSMRSLDFSIDLILPAALWPGVDSATNRNEYQESSWGVKGDLQARKANKFTAICEPIIYRICGSLDVSTLWASTVYYRDSFTFLILRRYAKHNRILDITFS
jgi:hypothetical protein